MATIRKPILPVRSVKTGNCAVQRATAAMKPAGYLISQINTTLIIGAKGEISAAIKPRIVIGPTAGAASKLAITLMGDTYPESETKTGEQKTIAAMGGARA